MANEQTAEVTEQAVNALMGSLRTLRQSLPPEQQTALDALVRHALSDDEVSGYDYASFNHAFAPSVWPSYEGGGSDDDVGSYPANEIW